jgi:hypothetical protein
MYCRKCRAEHVGGFTRRSDCDLPLEGDGIQDLVDAGRVGTGFNVVTGPVRLQVAAGDAGDARAVLADLIADEKR